MDTEGALPGMVGYFYLCFYKQLEFNLILSGVVHAWALVGFLMVVLREDTIFSCRNCMCIGIGVCDLVNVLRV